MCWCVLAIIADCGIFFFKQKTAYEMRISDWSSDVCSSDLEVERCALRERTECKRHLIYIDAYRWTGAQGVIIEANAAQSVERRTVLTFGKGETRSDLRQIACIAHARRSKLLACCCRNRQAHVVNPLRPLLRRHADIATPLNGCLGSDRDGLL